MDAQINFENKENYTLLKLEGDFNSNIENEKLLNTFRNLANDSHINVIIDLTNVVYLNSGSIGTLLSGNAILRKKNGKLAIFGASDYINNIFNITKLNLAIEIFESFDDALKYILS